jgi:hypothetical protein
MSQLIAIASDSGESLCFKCPYQAKVVKMLERDNKSTGTSRTRAMGMAASAVDVVR